MPVSRAPDVMKENLDHQGKRFRRSQNSEETGSMKPSQGFVSASPSSESGRDSRKMKLTMNHDA